MVRYSQLPAILAFILFIIQPSTAGSTDTPPSFKALVSGDVDEILVLAFALDQIVGVDGDVRTMQPADCRTSFTVTAADVTGVSSDTFRAEVNLSAGGFQHVVIPFSSFHAMSRSYLIVRISGLTSSGPCALLRSSFLATAGSGKTRGTGVVKWFNESKGFGFIAPSDETED
jgi:hypothetical protein